MNPRLGAIEAKRARLIERAARERALVAQALQAWERPLGLIGRCLEAARRVLVHPPLVAGAALILVLLRPRRALKWVRRTLVVWRSYRWVTQKLAR